MKVPPIRIALLVCSLAIASPAMAQAPGVALPEPSSTLLLGLGVLGLVVGRRVARKDDVGG